MRGDYLRRKSEYYRQLKRDAEIRGVPLNVSWRHVNIPELQTAIAVRARPNFIREVREGRRTITFPFTENGGVGTRTYFVNNYYTETSQTRKIMSTITQRINHALRTGITENADVNIRFHYLYNQVETSKSFNSFLVKDTPNFRNTLINYVETTNSNQLNYVYRIIRLVIKITRENGGGCNKSGKDKHYSIDEVKFTSRRAKENNCFFENAKEVLSFSTEVDSTKQLRGRALGSKRNNIRSEFGLEANSHIPISIGLKIFEKYRKTDGCSLSIKDMDTKKDFKVDSKGECTTHVCLKLEDSHYEIYEDYPLKKCDDCLSTYRIKHKCDPKRVSYVNAKIKKTGRVLLNRKTKKADLNNKDVIHYDLETHVVNKIHTPYIVGWNEGDKFLTFEGDECMIKFVDMLIEKGKSRGKNKVYVNAFNGANFDHYFIYKEFMRRKIKPDAYIINNGSIVKFEYKNIKLFDVCKHLQGSLKDNLKSLNCTILKGDFDHKLASRWEDMREDLRSECKKYLFGDVMGLKELYEKVNSEIYDKYKINITSFISTSSLTFNLWKGYVEQYNIKLPTMEEEKAFRQSVRGGRTYKTKNNFKSNQYDDFKSGKIGYDEIDDFIVDADVVSLYPTAMAKFEYPVGDCKILLPYQVESTNGQCGMMGKMGVYFIKYTTNKNLQHAIGGRRAENGALKWDLKDCEGYYTSVDIEDMIENGYKVEIISGYYWEKTEMIFKEYIEALFKKKESSKKGSVEYSLAKLFMNALYGKMIQRPIYNKTELIKTNSDYWKFWSKHIINGIDEVGEYVSVSGTPRDELTTERCITKPTHLGAFILAYSRRIMLGYMKESNPYFNSTCVEEKIKNDFYYTDTDSLQMHVRNAKLMKNLGDKNLGGITDDLGDGKIVKGIWIAPKLYMLEYIKKGETTSHYHFRGKGLSKDSLTVKAFEDMDSGKSLTSIRDFQMKKIHIKRNSNQQDIPQFSIVHLTDIKKIVNSNKWSGRNFNGNSSLPWL